YNEAKQTYESNYWYNKSGTEKEEKKILLDSMTFITEAIAGGARLVTFNGKTFDIPYMVKRAILLKVIPENINLLADVSRLTRRFYNDIHYDVCEILNGGSANEWGYLLGLVKSPERKGDQIAELYKKKKHNEIVAKNTEDLE